MEPLRFLDSVRTRLRAALGLDGGARLFAYLTAGFLLIAVLDYINTVPAWLRAMGLAALMATAAVVIWRRFLRPLRQDMSAPVLAGLAERRIPGLDGRLFTAVDGLPLSEQDQAVITQRCDRSALRDMVRFDRSRRSFGAAVALALVLGAIAWQWPAWLGTAGGRVFLPWSQQYAHPRSCAVEAHLEQPVVSADAMIVLRARALRGGPAPLRVEWEARDGKRSGSFTAESLTGPWREQLALPPGEHRIAVGYGDSRQDICRALVVERPELESIAFTITPPAYAGLAPTTVASPSAVEVLAGSRIEAAFSFTRHPAAEEQELAVRYGDALVPVTQGEDGKHRFALPITQGAELHLDASDRHRFPGYDEAFAIDAYPRKSVPVSLRLDARPRVHLHGPRPNEAVTLAAEIPLQINATDDLGLTTLELRGQLRGDQADAAAATQAERDEEGYRLLRDFDLPLVAGQRQRETSRAHKLVIADQAAEGQELLLVAVARDANDITGPGEGRSDPLALRVVKEQALREEFDRMLGEARDRLSLARDQLAPGIGEPEKMTMAARSARSVARRAEEHLNEVRRRWQQNKLESEPLERLGRAADLVAEQALPRLSRAASGDRDLENARSADRALGEAERALASLLQSGDLADTLARLLEQERSLATESSTFVVRYATRELDAPGDALQGSLTERQAVIARQLKEWESRLLSESTGSREAARELVRDRQPAGLLAQAADVLARDRGRKGAIAQQQEAIAIMEQLLQELRGGQDAAMFAAAAGELADREEALARELEEGAPPGTLRERQDQLRRDTEALAKRMDEEGVENQDAQGALAGAQGSQERAADAMGAGDRSGAQREARTAADQLRQAQRALEGEAEQDQAAEDDEDEQQPPDILALIERLRDQQARVVRDLDQLHQDMGAARERRGQEPDAPLTFGEKRMLAPVAEREEGIQLVLQEEGIKALDNMPIAKRALERVDAALGRSVEYLLTPALGERGLRLAATALYELERLLAIVDSMPSGDEQEPEEQGPQGDQQANQAPFPPRAQIALVASEQRELRALTAAGYPADLATRQAELRDLCEALVKMTRPGSRPHVLLQRGFRAAASAAYELEQGDERLAHTLNEQDTVSAALTRVLAEAKRSRNQQPQPSPSQRSQRSERQTGESERQRADRDRQGEDGQQEQEGDEQQETPGEVADVAEGEAGDEATVETPDETRAWLMRFPPVMRRQLQESLDRELPVEGLMLYRRFLELLLEESP
ncbi:MAG: hypothetical protein ACOCYP_09065 [Planctomycetota bacterium]